MAAVSWSTFKGILWRYSAATAAPITRLRSTLEGTPQLRQLLSQGCGVPLKVLRSYGSSYHKAAEYPWRFSAATAAPITRLRSTLEGTPQLRQLLSQGCGVPLKVLRSYGSSYHKAAEYPWRFSAATAAPITRLRSTLEGSPQLRQLLSQGCGVPLKVLRSYGSSYHKAAEYPSRYSAATAAPITRLRSTLQGTPQLRQLLSQGCGVPLKVLRSYGSSYHKAAEYPSRYSAATAAPITRLRSTLEGTPQLRQLLSQGCGVPLKVLRSYGSSYHKAAEYPWRYSAATAAPITRLRSTLEGTPQLRQLLSQGCGVPLKVLRSYGSSYHKAAEYPWRYSAATAAPITRLRSTLEGTPQLRQLLSQGCGVPLKVLRSYGSSYHKAAEYPWRYSAATAAPITRLRSTLEGTPQLRQLLSQGCGVPLKVLRSYGSSYHKAAEYPWRYSAATAAPTTRLRSTLEGTPQLRQLLPQGCGVPLKVLLRSYGSSYHKAAEYPWRYYSAATAAPITRLRNTLEGTPQLRQLLSQGCGVPLKVLRSYGSSYHKAAGYPWRYSAATAAPITRLQGTLEGTRQLRQLLSQGCGVPLTVLGSYGSSYHKAAEYPWRHSAATAAPITRLQSTLEGTPQLRQLLSQGCGVPLSTLKATPTCISHSGTASYKTYIATLEESECTDIVINYLMTYAEGAQFITLALQ